MKRREFITFLSSVAIWPVTARAQEHERMRRIGVLMHVAADDAEGQARTGGIPAGVREIGLGRWPQRPDRHALGGGSSR